MMKGRNRGYATRGTKLALGEFGLKAIEAGRINSRQIEAARQAYTRHVKRQAKSWIRVFPDKPITKKPLETRMGKGKGQPELWVAVVKKGKIMFEIAGVDEATAREALRLAMHKLPVTCKFVKKEESGDVA